MQNFRGNSDSVIFCVSRVVDDRKRPDRAALLTVVRDSCATRPVKMALKPGNVAPHVDSAFDSSALAEAVSPLHSGGAPCTRERCKRRSCCVSARSS